MGNLNIIKLQKKLNNKTVLITGASSGIGEQLAYMLGNISTHLILVARREEKLLEIKDKIEKGKARVSIFPADLRNNEDMDAFLQFLHTLPDGLDVVISNAGISIRRSIFDSLYRYHDFTRTMAINYFAPVKLLLTVIPILEEKKGHIINISTINNLMIPFPNWAAYQASKGAFDTWFRATETELNAVGISTTSIYFPLVRTPMILPTAAYKNAPAMSPHHAAKIICKSIYTKRKKYAPWWMIFAQLASVIFRGLWERLAPRILGKKRDGK
jgi:short-subunit dehydrogenase